MNIKKISRFRRWLIHKLGGISPDDVIRPEIKYDVANLKILQTSYCVPKCGYEKLIPKEIIENDLHKKICSRIKIDIQELNDEKSHNMFYLGRIVLPEKYIKEVPNDRTGA